MNGERRTASLIITFWVTSVISAITLYYGIEATFAEGEFKGFKIGGGMAACVVIFLLLIEAYKSLSKADLEIHLREFQGEEPENLQSSKLSYKIVNKNKSSDWVPAELIVQDKDKYIFVPSVNFSDVVEVQIESSNGIWKSDKVQSSKRHLLFNKVDDTD